MNTVDIIAKKRDGGELTQEEISFFIQGVTDRTIEDYQAAAWLMAVYLRGMTPCETLDLTLAMRDSGKRIDLSDLPHGPALDKHSTGGVGDKTTLVVVPILAAAGVPILKMSGRGLGYSGGTVDKLESIPGFRSELSLEEAKAQVEKVGAALIAQSEDLAPADKILYGLRDVTATVECIPLIASSIMSKKLAAGGQRIVLDVKVGRGAFMKTRARAEELARQLVEIGKGAGIPTSAVLTAMEEPLGHAVGNALEVREAIDMLRHNQHTYNWGVPKSGQSRFYDLCIELAAHGLVAVGKVGDLPSGRTLARELVDSGAAAERFAAIVAAQGGPDSCEAILEALPYSTLTHVVEAETIGTIVAIDAEAIGRLATDMGAGRLKKGDRIDPRAGIHLQRKTGADVVPEVPLATLHMRAEEAHRTEEFAARLKAAYCIVPTSEAPPIEQNLLLGSLP